MRKRPFCSKSEPEAGDGLLLFLMSLKFLMPTSLQSSASATITSGCLPIWNLITVSVHRASSCMMKHVLYIYN